MKRLAIVGTGSVTRDNAPWKDTGFDIWVFNEAPTAAWCKRWDAVFQMHPQWNYMGENRKNPDYPNWLKQAHGKPIWMQAVDPLVPDSVEYPLQAAIDLVGVRYLTATVCYALALAKLQGYERVDIYGIEMSATEYQYQAECYRFWLGYLKGAGIEVNLCSGMPLFDALLYGYDGVQSAPLDYFKGRAAQHATAYDLALSNAKGHQRTIERILAQDKTKQIGGAVLAYHEAAHEMGRIAGMLGVAEYYAEGGHADDRGTLETDAALAQRDEVIANKQFYMLLGRVEYVGNVWEQTRNVQAKAQLAHMIVELTKQAEKAGRLRGTYLENIEYIMAYDKRAKAMGVTQAG